jgi:hypothetical protein
VGAPRGAFDVVRCACASFEGKREVFFQVLHTSPQGSKIRRDKKKAWQHMAWNWEGEIIPI